jgi:hypothetical protein
MSHSIGAAHDPSDRVRRGHLPSFAREEKQFFAQARRVPERTLMGGLDGHQSVAPLIARTLSEDQQ